MAVGFFVAVSPTALSQDETDSAFLAHTLWETDGGERAVDLQGPGWRFVSLKDHSGASSLWKEEPATPGCSFVQVLGWCYRISSSRECLAPEDYSYILARFRAGKPPLDDDFGGGFVVVVYDAHRRRLAIQPDRLALGGVFFAESDGVFVASNRAVRVASYCRSALDGHSVLAHMRGTHIPFGRTLFAGVHRVMGSQYLDLDFEAGVGGLRKPDSLFLPTREISYGEAIDVVAEVVKSTVRRLLNAGPVQFDLTGGNDTRVLASAVENLTRSNGSHHFGFRVADPEGTPDVRVARRLAETCGWRLTRVDRYPLAAPDPQDLAHAATTGDGNFPAHYIWDRISSDRVYAREGDWKAHVGAASGELFRGFFYTHEILSLGHTSDLNYAALLAFRTYASRGVNLKVFGTSIPTFEVHDQALLAPYRALGQEGARWPRACKLDVMYLQRHCYRSGNTLSYLLGFSNARVPFLSWELAGLGLALPWQYRANRSLIQRVIAKLSPKLADIPNEDGLPMRPLSALTLPTYLAAGIPIQVDRATRVMRRFLGRSAEIKRAGLPKPQPAYFSVVNQAVDLPDLFDAAVVRGIAAEAASEQRSRDSVVTFYTLATVELLLRQVSRLQRKLVFSETA